MPADTTASSAYLTAAAETTALQIAAEEDGQNPVMNFIGKYQSGRRSMLVEAQGTDAAKVTVRWGPDERTYAEWILIGKIAEDSDGLVMRYNDGTYAMVEGAEDGGEIRSEETDGLTGTIRFKNEGAAIWTDDQNEQIDNLMFTWVPASAEEEPYEDPVTE